MADSVHSTTLPSSGTCRPVYVPPPAPRRAGLRLITARLCLGLAEALITAAGRLLPQQEG